MLLLGMQVWDPHATRGSGSGIGFPKGIWDSGSGSTSFFVGIGDRGLGCTFFVLGGIEFGVVDRVVDHL